MDLLGYKITEQLHQGPRFFTYKALHQNDQAPIVIRMLRETHPSDLELKRLRQEYKLLQHLQHPQLVRYLAMEKYNGKWAIVREMAAGIGLQAYLSRHHLELTSFFTLATQLANAIKALHSHKIIHKKISAANILVNPKDLQLKLAGFSLASEMTREAFKPTAQDVYEAELAYVSPEQTGRLNRTLDYHTDYYSLGIVLYQLLTGRLPFTMADPMEVVHSQIARQPEPPYQLRHGIPLPLSELVLKLMAKEEADRYQSIDGLLFDLEGCAEMVAGKKKIFELGTNDISDQFSISGKLYGREAEMQQLAQAFNRVRSGAAELLVVAGYSGVGKSSLVGMVQKQITANNAFFISGKFDQYKMQAPMGALLAAFRSLVQQLLRLNEKAIEGWRHEVLQAVGDHGRLLTGVVPELELLIGPQPPVQELPLVETTNRFYELFSRFINVFAKPEHPLCIFLDDLQWIDSATRQWIEIQLAAQNVNHFFLVCAYRSNEVSAAHPAKLMLDKLYKAGVPVHTVMLEPLDISCLTQLIADSLLSTNEACVPLAHVIFQKTAGNPFFTRQCLLSLYENGAVYFDQKKKSWAYSLDKVHQVQISDNVVDLMVRLIERLAVQEQQTLKLAACIGNHFKLQTLSTVSNEDNETLATHISTLLKKGLIVPAHTWGEAATESYTFLHDRVRQAAMLLFDDAAQKIIRLQIGRLLLQNSGDLANEKDIYLIADHLNFACSLITDDAEKKRLAEVNLAACQQAKNATAYELGKRYIVQAMNMLPQKLWQQPSLFIADLYLQRAECEHLCGDNESAATYYDLAIAQPKSSIDKARYYQRKIHYHTNLRKFDAAYHTGREAVLLLGVKLPRKFIPPLFIKELVTYRVLLGAKKIPDLAHLPEMTNERMKMAILLMSTIARAAYQIQPELCVALCTRMVNICLRHGNTEGGYIGFLALGPIFLGAVLKQRQTGYDYGQLTLTLAEKYKSLAFKAEIYFVVGYFAIPWRRPAEEMESYWQTAFDAGLQSGDHFHASCACCGTIQSMYMRGLAFEEIQTTAGSYKDFLQRTNNEEGLLTLQAVLQSMNNLAGKTKTHTSFDDEHFIEAEYVQKLETFASRHFAHYYFINKMQTLYLWGEYTKAHEVSLLSDQYLKDSPGMMHTAEHDFFKGLILAALLQRTTEKRFSKKSRQLFALTKKLSTYAAGCPTNFLHKSMLLQAEASLYEKDWANAEKSYHGAIEAAANFGYRNIQALASLRLAQFYLLTERKKLAGFYLQEATYTFWGWGAEGLALFFAQQYPELATTALNEQSNRFARNATGELVLYKEGKDLLDLETVLKSSQAISTEIHLNNLVSTLMKIIIENAGAGCMVLLLENNNELQVKAERKAGDAESVMLNNIPLSEYSGLPRSVVNYVMRTLEPVILENACNSDTFPDSFFEERKTKSVLCTALVLQGKLTGVIYLENNLTHAAFTKERIDLVLLLSGQMAISINNALLYENLEEKVKERTIALKEAMDRSDSLLLNILPAETAEELKQTGSSKAKVFDQVTVMFTDFKNFTTLSEKLSAEELVSEINYCYSAFDNIVSGYGIEKIKTIGDSYMCAGGLPVENQTNPEDTLMAAIDIRNFMLAEMEKRGAKGAPFFEIRIGLHTGRVVAGIVGTKKFAYDIWGDTVNIASRMESSGEPGKINISAATYALVQHKFICQHRGKIDAKNKGSIDMYFVEGTRNAEAVESYWLTKEPDLKKQALIPSK